MSELQELGLSDASNPQYYILFILFRICKYIRLLHFEAIWDTTVDCKIFLITKIGKKNSEFLAVFFMCFSKLKKKLKLNWDNSSSVFFFVFYCHNIFSQFLLIAFLWCCKRTWKWYFLRDKILVSHCFWRFISFNSSKLN